jgi:hypothetical protein
VSAAQFNLASCYELGQGLPQDFTQAAKWYRSAARSGHSGAQSNLASLYESGHGVPKDAMEAVRLYLLAAGNGNAKAALNLGSVFANGVGVSPDHALAYMWLQVAAEWGEDVRDALGTEAKQLNDSEMRNAQEQALKWMAQHRLNSESASVAQLVSGN